MQNVTFQPIGKIISDFKKVEDTYICCEKGLKVRTQAQIKVYKRYQDGLVGLGKFSHLFVIYHLNKIIRVELTTYPGPTSVKNLPQVGIFASRSQYRPNPIALRLVKLLKIEENLLIVQGLDGIHGSPVIDIKPYVPGFDRPEFYTFADWYKWLK